jgi:hypothetical protein
VITYLYQVGNPYIDRILPHARENVLEASHSNMVSLMILSCTLTSDPVG